MQYSHYDTMYRTEMDHWWYRVRRQMIHFMIGKYVPQGTDMKGLKILDIGCGTGALLKELDQYGDCFGVDFSSQAVQFCIERGILQVKEGSIAEIPYPDESFDLVLALDILEHIPDDSVGIREINRVLKKGGKGIIFVPTFNFLWGVTDVRSEHYLRYTKGELLRKLKLCGFSIMRSSYFNFFLFPFILTVRLFVRIFGIKVESENTMTGKFTNKILYIIFRFESLLGRVINYPVGVSAFAIVTKK